MRPCPLSLVASSSPRPGCGSQRLLRCRSHPAGRCPNSSSLFPPLAAVVAVAPKGEPLACRSGSPSYNLSVSLRSTAPLVGEPLAKPFTLRGLPRPLPLGEVALRSNDGEGKPGRKEPLRSDGQALCQSDAIAVPELFVSGLALSVSLRSPALPEGEPLPERAP